MAQGKYEEKRKKEVERMGGLRTYIGKSGLCQGLVTCILPSPTLTVASDYGSLVGTSATSLHTVYVTKRTKKGMNIRIGEFMHNYNES